MTALDNWALAHIATGGLASLIFLYQTLGSAHSDAGNDGDVGHMADISGTDADGSHWIFEGYSLSDFLSVRNFVAFFMGYGWVTLAASLSGNSREFSAACGAAAGAVFVLMSFFLLKTFLKFQEDGSLKLETLTGGYASVYITISSKGASQGKVLVDTKAGRVELPARTRDEDSLRPGVRVRILGPEGGVLWVTAKDEQGGIV